MTNQDVVLSTSDEQLIADKIQRVAVLDDAFDTLAVRDLNSEESQDLWRVLEFDPTFHEEIEQFGTRIGSADDLNGELIDALLNRCHLVPRFMQIWAESIAGQRVAESLGLVNAISDQLVNTFGLDVRKFGSDPQASDVIEYRPQLIFLDWYLGGENLDSMTSTLTDPQNSPAVDRAIATAKNILNEWPEETEKPLIVLMSSKPRVEDYASEFCRRANILRGMFYAVPRNLLNDPFSLKIHLHLFAMSMSAAQPIQAFIDALHEQFSAARERFFDDISELTLADYSYINSLSLKDDGQPLGDYLFWIFNAYLGHLVFGDALRTARQELDNMVFADSLPSIRPPSDKLAEIYYASLFDSSVGTIAGHSDGLDTVIPTSDDLPVLTIGDILVRRGLTDVENGNDADATLGTCVSRSFRDDEDQPNIECDDYGTQGFVPDIYLVLNPQCDLVFTPDPRIRPADRDRSIFLMPGTLKGVRGRIKNDSNLKTELYRRGGLSYRIEWDAKKVRAIRHAEFNDWADREGFVRESRLRLPFALELQRAFSADITRIGSAVAPPIFQLLNVRLLVADAGVQNYVTYDELSDGEAAFLVLTRHGQQCVLTLPLLAKLKDVLDDKRVRMDESDWKWLRSPFKLPTTQNPKNLGSGRCKIVIGVEEGQAIHSATAVALSLSTDNGDAL